MTDNTQVTKNGDINMSEDYIITTQDIVTEATEGLGTTMFKYMKLHQDKCAQIDAKTGQKDTYQDLLQRCVRTALYMSSKNITENDIVSLCTHNHLNSVVPFIAAQFIGAKVASLDPSFSQKEMLHLLKQVKPKILFVNPESVSKIEKILADISLNSEIVVFGNTKEYSEFSECLKPQEGEAEFQPVQTQDIHETAIIYFSSGTTGLPKGICVSHYGFITQMHNATHTEHPDFDYMRAQAERVSFPLTFLYYTSQYWISAGAFVLSSIMAGTCRLVCPEFDGKEIWDLIQRYKPIFMGLTPAQVIEMLKHPRPDNANLRSVLSIVIMGSGISKEYVEKLSEIFPDVDIIRGYGQTEVCGSLTMFRGNDKIHRPLLRSKLESVGLPQRGISYKVVDLETNKAVGFNQRGELRIKSKMIMNGYHNLDSSESFDEDGWLKTGDVVYYDEDYCFYIVDRIKESFKYRGWFISPALLENVLLAHPAVQQAVVIGVPRDDGHHPMGLVVLHENAEAGEEEIEKFVEERVPERQRLRAGVKFIKSVPLTLTGKVKRMELKKMVLEGRL